MGELCLKKDAKLLHRLSKNRLSLQSQRNKKLKQQKKFMNNASGMSLQKSAMKNKNRYLHI